MRPIALLIVLALVAGPARGADDPLPTVATKTEGLRAVEGLLDLFVDDARGRVWLRVPATDDPRGEWARTIYAEGLRTGLGANAVGLDRGKIGGERVVAWRRVGGRVFVEALNLGFRALSESPDEQRAVEESFATSVVWAGPIAAIDEDGTALVDFTSFIVRDAHGVVATMRRTGQGSFALDEQRSAPDLGAILSFPDNLELEALVTYASDEPGPHVRATAPAGDVLTVTQHHSIIRLPEDGYAPRPYDPRLGFFPVSFIDYAQPLDAPLVRRWIVRHRLEKVVPGAAPSRVREPIVYYVDRGAPEPVRSALVEGASWWADAFAAAGFVDAFRVEIMPEDAHPLDVRYNVIQWVHRSTRGWSYGGGIKDPRTGEMLKGHVSLGSLRVRQDRLLFEGLLGTDATGTGAEDDPVEIALARIRQLAAHEVGHTLGLAHNFAASSYGRASVMDYPAPLLRVRADGSIDCTEAYAVGIGAWDAHCIRYGYGAFDAGTDEAAALDAIARAGVDDGLLFLSDGDARPLGGAQPAASLWDNGADPVDELETTLRVRAVALRRFGERNVAPGRPLAELEEVLVPLYLHHRYQVEAAAKVIGGVLYTHAVRGDGQPGARAVPATEQRRALAVLLTTLDPATLDLDDDVLALLLPRPSAYGRHEELFANETSPAFDALGAAATAADVTLAALLEPARCARLVDAHRRDEDAMGLDEYLRIIQAHVFRLGATPRDEALRRVVQRVWVRRLVALAATPSTPAVVRARAEVALDQCRMILTATERAPSANSRALRAEITRFLERRFPDPTVHGPAAPAPPGSPIGAPAGLGACGMDG